MDKPAQTQPQAPETIEKAALVGNPNVGKSVVFGWLTGQYVTVSNYPGTTVEVIQGNSKVGGRRKVIVDTPGIHNLIPMSEDERVTRDILLQDEDRKIIQVCDAKNLRRGLMITLQLAEMGKSVVLVLNMIDEARERGISIDHQGLSRLLGVPVIPTVATRRQGLDGLAKSLEGDHFPRVGTMYDPGFEESIAEIEKLLRGRWGRSTWLKSFRLPQKKSRNVFYQGWSAMGGYLCPKEK
jgi:ferrous iron transport protein B